MIHEGDCVDIMATFPENSVDAVVTDPPYHLGFMGKEWDQPGTFVERRSRRVAGTFEAAAGNHNPTDAIDAARTARVQNLRSQEWHLRWATEALRVLKPGGHLLAFGGTRTYHRLVCALEDAGFEIRDTLAWVYASGFPKSKSMREIGRPELGTGLKPAHEPIVLARKPLSEPTVAANVLRWGTGALNVDGCRIALGPNDDATKMLPDQHGDQPGNFYAQGGRHGAVLELKPSGRWPSNLLLDEEAAGMLDEQSGERTSGKMRAGVQRKNRSGYAGAMPENTNNETYGDSGGASRFFYVAKASRSEREAQAHWFSGMKNAHPTVKPVSLMRYLCRLVTPPGGVVLDPFLGSGSTAVAAILEGFQWIGIEKDPGYVRVARIRTEETLPLLTRNP